MVIFLWEQHNTVSHEYNLNWKFFLETNVLIYIALIL